MAEHDSDVAGTLIFNPVAGDADHESRVRDLARDHELTVRQTEEEGDAIALAREAAEAGVDLLAVAGGDGTVNEAVCGLRQAGALREPSGGSEAAPTLAIVPVGTGNDFAQNIGIGGISHAFDRLEGGERRWIDVGVADTADGEERPFVNSCVAGVTAEGSAETNPGEKARFGTLAYVLNTLQAYADREALRLRVRAESSTEDGETWTGEAICVLVGNARRFPSNRPNQADVEDGEFEVAIVEEQPAARLASEVAAERLFGTDASHISYLLSPSLTLDVRDAPATFSLDGELLDASRLELVTLPRALRVCVGETYDPSP